MAGGAGTLVFSEKLHFWHLSCIMGPRHDEPLRPPTHPQERRQNRSQVSTQGRYACRRRELLRRSPSLRDLDREAAAALLELAALYIARGETTKHTVEAARELCPVCVAAMMSKKTK